MASKENNSDSSTEQPAAGPAGPPTTDGRRDGGPAVQEVPAGAVPGLVAGEEWQPDPRDEGSVGRTMFDAPGSSDNSLTVLLPRDSLNKVPSQALLRIESWEDERTYLAIVTAGPFAEPDGLRADAPTVVTTAVRGATAFVPRYHGRVQIELLGERIDGVLVPPRFRPLPNSPVFPLDTSESRDVLSLNGAVRLGTLASDPDLVLEIEATKKSVLPRHTGILGTTGGGKSTTVSKLIEQAQREDFAVILLDTEGEYTCLDQPTDDQTMIKLLEEREESPKGVQGTELYYLAGKETSNPSHGSKHEFDLSFNRFSPFIVPEILDLSSAQTERFEQSFDTTRALLRELKIFPRKGNKADEKQALELDEFETGYPNMKLDHLIDVVRVAHDVVSDQDPSEGLILSSDFKSGQGKTTLLKHGQQLAGRSSHKYSWRALYGHLHRLRRLRIFDSAEGLNYDELLKPGRVNIFDLSEIDTPAINNLVIADVLRGVQVTQESNYKTAEAKGKSAPKVLIIIEEAHEFLAEERISKMPVLFQQVSRIAKRGRKRWLGLVFVTQLPRHLPPQVMGLINNWVLHRISDADTVSRLRRTVAGVDDALWQRLPGLPPGQAIISFTSMTRPVLAAVDPTSAKLRMLE
jgi:DNA helicase HerA-like ATPase